MKISACGAAVVAIVLVGCHTITEELPTEPSHTPASGVLTVPIPSIPLVGTPKPSPKPSPTPGPTPTPAPAPTPTPTPTPAPTPTPGALGCGDPVPTAVTRMTAKIHTKGPNNWTLDSTPLVGPDGDYCRRVGFTDGRSYCAVRTEGSPDRVACESLAVGKALDTGHYGPTWYWNGQLCSEQPGHCDNVQENQYMLLTYTSGSYMACASNDVCVTVEVVR